MHLAKTSVWGLALALAASAPAVANTVKVGVVLTFSGNGAEFGQQIERGMELYLAEAGKAKLGDNHIELIKRDAKGPGGAIAKAAVQELIVRDKVDLLTGFVFSPNIIASAPLISQAKVPTLILNAATAWIPSLSPYLARVSMTMWQTSYPMGQYAFQKLGCKTAAVGYTDYPPGKDALEAFKTGFEKAGGRLVDAVPMGGPAEVPDFTPFMQRVKDAKPDCFYGFVPRRCSRPTPSSA
jgi:branched-chain amino acid transport system substrate-binding protein